MKVPIYNLQDILYINFRSNNIITDIVKHTNTSTKEIYWECYEDSKAEYNNLGTLLVTVFVNAIFYSYAITANPLLVDNSYKTFVKKYDHLITIYLQNPQMDGHVRGMYNFVFSLSNQYFGEDTKIEDIENLDEVLLIYHKLGQSVCDAWLKEASPALNGHEIFPSVFFRSIMGIL